jgi:hypothetical protein
MGFLLFLVGHTFVFFGFGVLEFLKPIGTMISIYAIVRWLMTSGLADKFKREKGEDGLTYFWNKIAIRLWSGMLFATMLFSSLIYLLVTISR